MQVYGIVISYVRPQGKMPNIKAYESSQNCYPMLELKEEVLKTARQSPVVALMADMAVGKECGSCLRSGL